MHLMDEVPKNALNTGCQKLKAFVKIGLRHFAEKHALNLCSQFDPKS